MSRQGTWTGLDLAGSPVGPLSGRPTLLATGPRRTRKMVQVLPGVSRNPSG